MRAQNQGENKLIAAGTVHYHFSTSEGEWVKYKKERDQEVTDRAVTIIITNISTSIIKGTITAATAAIIIIIEYQWKVKEAKEED